MESFRCNFFLLAECVLIFSIKYCFLINNNGLTHKKTFYKDYHYIILGLTYIFMADWLVQTNQLTKSQYKYMYFYKSRVSCLNVFIKYKYIKSAVRNKCL